MSEKSKEPTGRAKGGARAAALMTPEQKEERARKGAIARWGVKALKATHKGNFNEELGVDAECYVLNDAKKSAVITQRGMGVILGLGLSGSRLPRLVFGKSMSDHVGPDLAQKIRNPVVFQVVTVGPNGTTVAKAHGYDAAVLIDICRAVLQAKAAGKSVNPAVVEQAGIIMGASAKAGIQGLVYALAGYRPEVEEVIQAFKAFVQEEAKKYEAEFPNELYEAWFKLYKIDKPSRGKPWQFLHLTRSHIYYPLAKSNGKILELLRALRAKDGEQKRYLFQFLNDIGARALRMQIGRVLEMAQSSNEDKNAYEAKIIERFGGQPDLPGIDPS